MSENPTSDGPRFTREQCNTIVQTRLMDYAKKVRAFALEQGMTPVQAETLFGMKDAV